MAEACLNLSGTMPTNCSALEFPAACIFFFFHSKIIPEKICFKGKCNAVNVERHLICTTIVATRVTSK